MQGTVFTLARLKIVPSYHQELVSMPEHLKALSFIHKITLETFHWQLLTMLVVYVSSVLPFGLGLLL